MNPMFLGIIIGLLLGVAIALGVALWLNRTALPSLERAKPAEQPPKLEARTPPAKPEAPKTAEAPKDGEKPRFEFYQILPGDKDGTKSSPKAADSKAKAEKAEKAEKADKVSKPAEKVAEKSPAPVASAPREVYYLQAGAFQSVAEADNLKARIALVGLSASVTATNVPDKGILHRVRLGPYQSLEPVNRIKTALSDAGIPAAVVKTTDVLN